MDGDLVYLVGGLGRSTAYHSEPVISDAKRYLPWNDKLYVDRLEAQTKLYQLEFWFAEPIDHEKQIDSPCQSNISQYVAR